MSGSGDPRADLTRQIKAEAVARGFDRVGIAPAGPADPEGRLEAWLTAGRHAGLTYMEKARATRADPRLFVPGARSVIALAISYYSPDPTPEPQRVAKYARGMDYHRVVVRKLRALRRFILRLAPGERVGPSLDYSPVLERAWAQKAGLGWIGKSTMLISPALGTYTFLAALVTTLELDTDPPGVDRCGSCSACIEACPTGAIVGPHQLDARRCITYWTVEHRGTLPASAPDPAGWVAGCDICQDVCPWNKFARPSQDARFSPRPALAAPDLLSWVRDRALVEAAIRGTALERTGAEALQRNAAVVLAARPAEQ